MCIRLTCAAVMAAILATGAMAQSPTGSTAPIKQVFERYRLLGIFAPDCTKPTTVANASHVFRLLGDNQAQYDFMTGPTERRGVHVIDTVSARGPNEVALSYGAAVERVDLVLRVDGNRWRGMERVENGRKVVSLGRFTFDEKRETLWLNKCG